MKCTPKVRQKNFGVHFTGPLIGFGSGTYQGAWPW